MSTPRGSTTAKVAGKSAPKAGAGKAAQRASATPARGKRADARPFTLFADYRQIHLRDPAAPGDLADAWTVQATEDRVAAADGVVGIGTAAAADVRVTLEVHAAAPADDIADWEHVTLASIVVGAGEVAVLGCTDYLPDARRVPLASGTWRVRASHRGLAKGREQVRLQLWPGPACAAQVERRWTPPPPPPPAPVSTRRPRTVKQATQAGRRGQTPLALEVLTALAAAGDAAAAAAAAELHAFAGAWAQVVPLATALLANPTAVYAGNVFTDQCRLLRRAARELADPDVIARAAKVVPAELAARRDACLLRDVDDLDDGPAPDARAAFADAVAMAATGKRFVGKPAALAAHCFALAAVYHLDDELIARWDPGNPQLGFDQAVRTARALARAGEPERAWAVIEQRLSAWYIVDHAQVAPVILLVDRWLAPLMTPARCAQVLATRRGGEA
ncbi:MAG: hypothetical protein R3B06_02305 [Kofleriaceae bacterium]